MKAEDCHDACRPTPQREVPAAVDLYPTLPTIEEKTAQLERDEARIPGFAEIFGGSEKRAGILRFARSFERHNPVALLFEIGMRALVQTSPLLSAYLTAESIEDSIDMPLNPFVALVGDPGSGKGLLTKRAPKFVPFEPGMVEAIRPASGEALGAMIINRSEDSQGRTRLKSAHRNLLIQFQETATLRDLDERHGNNTVSTLLSVFSNESIGCHTKKNAESSFAKSYTYRAGMEASVQPGNLGFFVDNEQSGLPQRFLWAFSATDPEWAGKASETPTAVIADLRKRGLFPVINPHDYPSDLGLDEIDDYLNDADGGKYLTRRVRVILPAAAVEECRADRAKHSDADPRNHAKHGIDELLQGHRLDRKVLVAVMLRLIDGPASPGPDDIHVTDRQWDAAEYLVRYSDCAYKTARNRYEEEAQDRATDRERVKKQARHAAQIADRTCKRILDLLQDAEKKNRRRAYDGLSLSEIKKNMSAPQRNFAERELEQLLAIGTIAETKAAGDGTARYRLAPQGERPEDSE